jgi:hypothetical protein
LIDTTTVQALSVVILLLTLMTTAVLSRRRRSALTLRPIAAYARVPSFVGRAVEADQPVQVGIGSSGIGGNETILSVVAAELAYQVARRASIGDSAPLLTTSDTSSLPLLQDALRRAYQVRNLTDRYPPGAARWYPDGTRSIVYAAALTTLMGDEATSSSVMAGSFGPELALILEAGARRDLPSIAMSDQPEGQAVAFALADAPLIGEELFVSRAYLEEEPGRSTETLTIDFLRGLLIIALLAGLIATIISSGG